MASYYYNSRDERSKDQISRGIAMGAWTLVFLLPIDMVALATIDESGSWRLPAMLLLLTAGVLSRLAANFWLRRTAPDVCSGTRQLV